MNYYFVDYENVKDLQGIENLSDNDQVIIFYTTNANTLTFKNHIKIQESKAKIEYKDVESGKNALDFQLGSYLGYLIGKSENNSKFCILSKDHDYDNIIKFWQKEKNITINQIVNFSGETKQKLVKKNNDQIVEKLKNSNLSLNEEQIKEIVSIIGQYKTKVSINKYLGKYFKDSEKVGKIQKVIKPYIKEKN